MINLNLTFTSAFLIVYSDFAAGYADGYNFWSKGYVDGSGFTGGYGEYPRASSSGNHMVVLNGFDGTKITIKNDVSVTGGTLVYVVFEGVN